MSVPPLMSFVKYYINQMSVPPSCFCFHQHNFFLPPLPLPVQFSDVQLPPQHGQDQDQPGHQPPDNPHQHNFCIPHIPEDDTVQCPDVHLPPQHGQGQDQPGHQPPDDQGGGGQHDRTEGLICDNSIGTGPVTRSKAKQLNSSQK